ncbi:DUF3199 family protein [Sporosarcina sp. resist]|uniref:protein YqbG n=1 Tax=Sporosarcina sp. resist TaxID=2762563 RepID=UPI00164ECDAF|nr:DUF3199 family protein [Sporosarcina sp. resist]QNK87752.1 DUF3199 family protein [Sporosarcina sp. resist]
MSITPAELKAYSVFEAAIERADNHLKMDILEAETYVRKKITKPLEDYNPLPPTLRLALLKIAEYFALVNGDESMVKGYKSEKIGDYSYQVGDGSSMSIPDVSDLLNEFVDEDAPSDGNAFLRMRSI